MSAKAKEGGTMQGVQYVVDERGRRVGVFLDFRSFPHLKDMWEKILEDIADLESIAERRDEEGIPLSALREELSRDGII